MDAGHLLQSGNHAGKSRRQAKKENRMESLYMNIWDIGESRQREENRPAEKEGLRNGGFSFFTVFRIFLLTLWRSRDIITKLTSDSKQFQKVLQKTSKNLLTERSKNDMITLVADTAAPQNSILSDVSEILQKDFKKHLTKPKRCGKIIKSLEER